MNKLSASPPRKLRRVLTRVLTFYCIACAVLVTIELVAMGVAVICFDDAAHSVRPRDYDLMAAYGTYMAREYPVRGSTYRWLARAVAAHVAANAMQHEELVKYLGEPTRAEDRDAATMLWFALDSGTDAAGDQLLVEVANGFVTRVSLVRKPNEELVP